MRPAGLRALRLAEARPSCRKDDVAFELHRQQVGNVEHAVALAEALDALAPVGVSTGCFCAIEISVSITPAGPVGNVGDWLYLGEP